MTIVLALLAPHLVGSGAPVANMRCAMERLDQPQLIPVGTPGIRMRLFFRIIGTWFIALGLVMLVIDGTKSLAANALVTTTLSQLWTQLHPPSLAAVEAFFDSRFFADLLDVAMAALLSYPAFAVFGVLGIVLALLGRRPQRERYLRTNQI
jgi:hypothetical protein